MGQFYPTYTTVGENVFFKEALNPSHHEQTLYRRATSRSFSLEDTFRNEALLKNEFNVLLNSFSLHHFYTYHFTCSISFFSLCSFNLIPTA